MYYTTDYTHEVEYTQTDRWSKKHTGTGDMTRSREGRRRSTTDRGSRRDQINTKQTPDKVKVQ